MAARPTRPTVSPHPSIPPSFGILLRQPQHQRAAERSNRDMEQKVPFRPPVHYYPGNLEPVHESETPVYPCAVVGSILQPRSYCRP